MANGRAGWVPHSWLLFIQTVKPSTLLTLCTSLFRKSLQSWNNQWKGRLRQHLSAICLTPIERGARDMNQQLHTSKSINCYILLFPQSLLRTLPSWQPDVVYEKKEKNKKSAITYINLLQIDSNVHHRSSKKGSHLSRGTEKKSKGVYGLKKAPVSSLKRDLILNRILRLF